MTIIMTLVGVVVFVFSLFTQTFKVAMKRLWTIALTGVFIDFLLISIAITITTVAVNY